MVGDIDIKASILKGETFMVPVPFHTKIFIDSLDYLDQNDYELLYNFVYS